MSQKAMKLALEALEDIKDDCSGCEFEWLNDYPLQAKAKLALEEALANHMEDNLNMVKQERPQNCGTSHCSCIECVMDKQEQGEPDDEVLGFNGWGFPIEHPPKPTPAIKEQIREALVFNLPLYTTPQQRKPLTDEQIKHIYISTTGWSISDSDPMLIDFARAIEAAHGIKG